ncbi:OTU domain-containing protein [Wolbachia endosymbiont (group B) of Melanostoma mellinum]|uniref:hypothetical protein n=1 Tax=Wolbachia endosymbiont (group B) of Melanostoma mellinum TaxID=2954030 RepID=UPI002231C8F6|nr:hypothetical protein [Wolbachia endosymbiont (group B) of Melanostoma mellinum]
MRDSNYVREPIALFQKIKENKKSSDLLHNLKSAYPEKLKIGAAIKTGDCFFDSVAQGLNELNIKPDYRFTAKSLRKDCADYARANKKPDQWVYKAVIRDAGEYFVPQKDPDGEVISENGLNKQDDAKSFYKYLECITNTHTADAPIWGRPNIEGRMICDKYKVELYIYSIEEDSQKVTVTKITAHDDDPEVFIQDINLNQLEIDSSKKTVGVVNYMRHFVPLLSEISEDITESQPVSNEEIFGEVTEVPASDQSEQEEQYNIRTSKSAIVQDHETQKERINTSASEPIHTDTVITISHPHEQKTQQEEIQKKLINSYRREAIYSIAAVITAIAFTASAIATVFTQPIPLACLAGVALAIACVCVYQLMQSHNDIHELKSEPKENIAHAFLEGVGLEIHSLIDKAISKV